MRKLTITTCSGLVLLLSLMSCATTPLYNPLSVSKEEIYATVDVIGPVPFYSQIKAEDLDAKLAAMEDEVTARLESAGFQVVPSSQYKKIYEKAKETIGPMYDSKTGELDKEKNKILEEQTQEEYLGQFTEVDAFFIGGIVFDKRPMVRKLC